MSKKRKVTIETVKMLDCQDMPDDVRSAFMECYECVGNDCIVTWQGWDADETDSGWDPDDEDAKRMRFVNAWLKEQGIQHGEKIVIKHWW